MGTVTSWRDFVDARRVVQVVALLLAAVAAAFLLGAPLYSGTSTSVTSDDTSTTTPMRATLVEVNGGWVIALLVAPVVLVAIHALWVGRGRTAAIVACTAPVAVLCVLGILTIGVFFLPAVILSGVALLVPAREPASPAPPEPRPEPV